MEMPAPPRTIMFDSAGPIRLVPDLSYEAFLPAVLRTDSRLIKRCPFCGRLFLANRIDKGACSPLCLGTNRQRKFREEYKLNRVRRDEEAAAKRPNQEGE
jgi:hypothetical protein